MSPPAITPTRPARAPRRGEVRPEGPDPRLRARHVAVAREAGRHRLARLAIASAVLAAVIGALVLIHSPLFSARVLSVSGAHQTSAEAVLLVAGLKSHPPLIDINTTAMAARVEALPWVGRAVIHSSWPDGVAVSITERVAVAYARLSAHSFALFDSTGRELARASATPPGLAPITSLSARTVVPGERLDRGDGQLALLAGALPESILSRVAGLSRTATQGLLLHLRNGPLVVIGIASDLPEKMTALATLLTDGSLGKITVIDLRVPSDPVLTP